MTRLVLDELSEGALVSHFERMFWFDFAFSWRGLVWLLARLALVWL